jgi:hypothetical protein
MAEVRKSGPEQLVQCLAFADEFSKVAVQQNGADFTNVLFRDAVGTISGQRFRSKTQSMYWPHLMWFMKFGRDDNLSSIGKSSNPKSSWRDYKAIHAAE